MSRKQLHARVVARWQQRARRTGQGRKAPYSAGSGEPQVGGAPAIELGKALVHISQAAIDPNTPAELLETVLETSPSVIYLFDLQEFRTKYANRQLRELLGYTPADFQAMDGAFPFCATHPDDHEVLQAHHAQVMQSAPGEVLDGIYRLKRADGAYRWMHSRDMVFARDAQGAPLQILGAAMDITEQLEMSEALQQQTARLRLLAELSRELVQAGFDYTALLCSIARRLAETLGDVCIINILSDDGNWLHPVAFHHANLERLAVLQIGLAPGVLANNGSLQAWVLNSCQSVRVEQPSDSEMLAAMNTSQVYARRYGVDSVLIVPMRAHGHVLGVLNLWRDSPGKPYSEADQELLEEMAGRVALAIINARLYLENVRQKDHLELAVARRTGEMSVANQRLVQELASRQRVEQQLRSSEQRYRILAENVTDVIWTTSLEGHFTDASPSVQRLLGYTPQQLVEHTLAQVLTAESYRTVREIMEGELRPERPWGKRREPFYAHTLELETICKDGKRTWVEAKISLLHDGDDQPACFLGVARDITERRQVQERLLYMATHDLLTGLPTRELFHDRLEQALRRARREDGQVAVMVIDLDNFKLINDTYGHACGDEALRLCAERMQGCLREMDTVARVGGDEFHVALEMVDGETYVAGVAQRILAALSEPFELEGAPVSLSASIGVCLFPRDGQEIQALVRRADEAMYRAKHRRAKVRFYER